jgi:putative chitinase
MSFDFNFTVDHVKAILRGNVQYEHWYAALLENLPEYEVNTLPRVAAFMAQTAHESMNYTRLHENLNYRAASLVAQWPSHFSREDAARMEHNQEAIANRAYCDRLGNGPEESGDGWKYKGRGIIQLTGKDTYAHCSEALYDDAQYLLDNPEIVETDMDIAVAAACWYWELNALNVLADKGDIKTMTRRINGGYIGLDERIAKYNEYLKILKG